MYVCMYVVLDRVVGSDVMCGGNRLLVSWMNGVMMYSRMQGKQLLVDRVGRISCECEEVCVTD